MNRSLRRSAALGGLVLLLAAGCSDDGLGKRYAVYGTVTYKGAPVAKGNIYFVPDDGANGRAANGTIDKGRYQLSTAGTNDGALPGTYKVRIMAVEEDYSEVAANAAGGAGRQDDVINATKAAKRLIPAKYELETTSNLTAEIKEQSNKIDFDLTD